MQYYACVYVDAYVDASLHIIVLCFVLACTCLKSPARTRLYSNFDNIRRYIASVSLLLATANEAK